MLALTYESLPDHVKKFWRKRYQLFSRYDEGIILNEESWYSVTPEDVARFTADLVQNAIPHCKHILDVSCGSGGNLIQFAKIAEKVVAVDINGETLECLEHNAGIYGVRESIVPVLGDWHELLEREDWVPEAIELFDFVFCSPPWGGPAYNQSIFDLAQMEPFNLRFLCTSLLKYCKNFGLCLPRSSDLDQVSAVARELFGGDYVRTVYALRDGHVICMIALFGPAFNRP